MKRIVLMCSLIALANCLSAGQERNGKLQQFIDDPRFQDQVFDYIVGEHSLMTKLLERISLNEEKRKMVIAHLSGGSPEALPKPSTAAHAFTPSPYGGSERREIKALSAEQIKGYLQGEGMGMAMPAELNHYPGPRHVLQLASELGLTAPQEKETERLSAAMHEKAVELGTRIVRSERELDKRFGNGTIDEESLRSLVLDIAADQGRLRIAHLEAHLGMKNLLSATQVASYDSLRGYTSAGPSPLHLHHD